MRIAERSLPFLDGTRDNTGMGGRGDAPRAGADSAYELAAHAFA